MINLKNGYGIVSDGKSYTLIQYAIQTSKNGEVVWWFISLQDFL